MKLLIVFFISLMTIFAGDQAAKKPEAVTVPAGAAKGEDGSYRFTDAQGKKWIYRKTPFGVARIEDKGAQAEADSKQDRYPGVKATEHGDVIRFERPGPFGVYRWEQKKTELNEMEQAVWDRENARAAKQD
ncbi:MAG TPA: hypothetical protein VE959_35370 [Bryobacteraceae bacterium]|nr:hypothetical protein [Bryobacteraceae bacterium]